MTGQEARDDEREALDAALDSERLRQVAEWLRMDLAHGEVADRLDQIAGRHDALARKHPGPEITEAVGFYVIPEPDAPDQDSLWDGTIHPTRGAAQASLDSAIAEWGHDAWNYRIVALVPVGEEKGE